jgi:hypothetical protein
MSDESGWSRDDIAQWVGTILWIVFLESHVISRPLVFLCGPFIMLSSFVIIAFPIRGKRLRQVGLFSVATSIGGFLLTKYVFRSGVLSEIALVSPIEPYNAAVSVPIRMCHAVHASPSPTPLFGLN